MAVCYEIKIVDEKFRLAKSEACEDYVKRSLEPKFILFD